MRVVTLSSKNQVTIPKEMLMHLELLPRKKLLIEHKEKEIVLRPLTSSIVEETAGSLANFVPKNKKRKSFQSILKETKKITARQLAKNL